tara:strand:+ start:139 stop:255 length:117 start_codon:yes stop_codon:yes gene_type:complete
MVSAILASKKKALILRAKRDNLEERASRGGPIQRDLSF